MHAVANKTKKFENISLEKEVKDITIEEKKDNQSDLSTVFVDEKNQEKVNCKEPVDKDFSAPKTENKRKKSKRKNAQNGDIQDEQTNTSVDEEFEKAIKPKKKKITWKKRLLNLGAITMLGVITGSGLGVWYSKTVLSTRDYSEWTLEKIETLKDDINDIFVDVLGQELTGSEQKDWVTLAKSKGLTPLDLTASQNVNLALHNITLAKSYNIVGSGLVKTIANQTVYGTHKFDGKTYESVAMSVGTFAKLAHKFTMDVGAGAVNYIDAIPKNDKEADWEKGTKSQIKTDDCIEFAGGLPSTIQPYIISKQTVLEESSVTIEPITDENGKVNYKFTVDLDPITSVLYYIRQMKMISKLGSFPEFNDVKQTFIIDENWHLVQIDILEHYSQIAVGVKASCEGTLTTTFDVQY